MSCINSTVSRLPCCQPESYCYKLWVSDNTQKKNDKDLGKSKITLVSTAIFIILAFVFAALLLRPGQPQPTYRKFLICFATFTSLIPVPLIIRNCTCFSAVEIPPPPKKKSRKSSESSSGSESSDSDDGKL